MQASMAWAGTRGVGCLGKLLQSPWDTGTALPERTAQLRAALQGPDSSCASGWVPPFTGSAQPNPSHPVLSLPSCPPTCHLMYTNSLLTCVCPCATQCHTHTTSKLVILLPSPHPLQPLGELPISMISLMPPGLRSWQAVPSSLALHTSVYIQAGLRAVGPPLLRWDPHHEPMGRGADCGEAGSGVHPGWQRSYTHRLASGCTHPPAAAH